MKRISKSLLDLYCRENIQGSIVALPPAGDEIINFTEKEIGVTFPIELVELYKIYNGIGMRSKKGDVYWIFHPLDTLFEFARNIREYFAETHPLDSNRFLPIYDWNSGDALGYLLSSDGKWEKGLFEFELEKYENEQNQPLSEFLSRSYDSLHEFLADK